MKILTNKGSRRLGIPGRPAIILGPGDSVSVTDKQSEDIHRNRTVARWLRAGRLHLSSDDGKVAPPEPVIPRVPPRSRIKTSDKREESVLPGGVTGEGIEVHHRGGGWYEVYVNGFRVTDSNIRKDAAKELAAEYE